MSTYPLLNSINSPLDIKELNIEQLNVLSEEIRQFIIKNVSITGGHLASNLGVIEITLALHYVFDSPFDKIIWDVGHQAYVHKILTQRKDMFDSLRQYGGISGFPKRSESVHDIFETGHSSTSISAALGISRARDIKGEKGKVIAVIGDGALTGGMAFEALNDAGHSKTDIIIVLNDNEMSISRNVGAVSAHLSKIRSSPKYSRMKKDVKSFLNWIPFIGKPMARGIERLKNSFKYLLVPGVIFEELGFTYMGPIDGHDIETLIRVIKRASNMHGPVLIHTVTKKGKGYYFAEKNPEKYHSIAPFNPCTGEVIKKNTKLTYSEVFGTKLLDIASKNDKIVAVTAAMPEGTGLKEFKSKFPSRFFDVGIAEQHAVTMAAGLAVGGLKPYVAIYSTFLQRAYDQILHDVCMQNLPVVFAIDRAGLVGKDGETHQGMFDISYLRHIPNITIMAPKNFLELEEMLDFSSSFNSPLAIRYPRGSDGILEESQALPLNSLQWEMLKEGKSFIVLIAVGKMVDIAYQSAQILQEESIDVAVVNARIIKPLDEGFLTNLAKYYDVWLTLEDNVVKGGFGSSINEFIAQKGYNITMINYGLPDKFITHGDVNTLMENLGLDPKSIAWQIKRIIGKYEANSYFK
ncbi:1-deoxy-D-xylulose-5-phosphate synthase [Xylanivirga thermophila]|uniref:1-deoxy-D-xylulose-5-phosphate synthase n=1 Tax=Xylanivirga thermophila TaxID=2496273 RepID=UPI00101C1FE7|nr:1-deoxy-D-xylulose-5-phosphate synthase [Xylanivirga thermophila]